MCELCCGCICFSYSGICALVGVFQVIVRDEGRRPFRGKMAGWRLAGGEQQGLFEYRSFRFHVMGYSSSKWLETNGAVWGRRLHLGVRAWLLLLFLRHENSVLVGYCPVKLKTGEVRKYHKCQPRNSPAENYSSSFVLQSPGGEMTFSRLSAGANQRGSLKEQWEFVKVSFSKGAISIWLLLWESFCNWLCINFLALILHQRLQLTHVNWVCYFYQVNFPRVNKINTTKILLVEQQKWW